MIPLLDRAKSLKKRVSAPQECLILFGNRRKRFSDGLTPGFEASLIDVELCNLIDITGYKGHIRSIVRYPLDPGLGYTDSPTLDTSIVPENEKNSRNTQEDHSDSD